MNTSKGERLRKMYQIKLDKRVEKELDRIPEKIFDRIREVISALKDNPRPLGVKKLTNQEHWRIRVGEYRILYEIDDGEKLITIFRIKHRRDVYK
jgi:mRNA interferase RelE/StbE